MKKLITTLLCAAFCGAQVLFSAEVKFVDYVESTGSQYVDLGIVGRSGMRVTTRMSWVTVPSDGGYIGARNGSTRFYPVYCYPSKWDIGYKDNYGGSKPVAGTIYDVVSVLKKGEQTLTVNGVANITQAVNAEYSSGLNLYLFAINYSSGNYNSSSRCYSLKIETNTVDGAWVTARYLMPIAVDGVGALYDMVSGKIYSSATATPLKASSSPSSAFSISRSALSTAGEIKVFAKVDTLDGLKPCTLTAVVHDCVSGETITKPLGVATDSELHEYKLSGLTPDGEYELTVHGSWPNLGVDGLESDLYVFQVSAAADTAKGSIYMVGPDAELDGDPMDWLVKSSGLHRLPLDGDKIIIGQTAGTYALNITNSVTRTFNGWTGAGAASVVSETTIGAGSTLNLTNATAYSGNKSGSKASFVVDGGTLHIKVNATDNMYGTDTLTIKNGGTFLRDGASGYTHSVVMAGTSRIYLQDGTFTITPASGQAAYNTLHFSGGGTPAFIQTGGTASCGSLSFQQQSDNYYEISGGSMTLSGVGGGIKHGNRSGSAATCGTLRMRGSKFTFAAQDVGYAYNSSVRTLLPTFFDYRIRSDADPGAKGVGFINYTGTGIKGAIRAIPDGGVAIVHTNLFPLIVQKSTKTLTFANDFKGGIASYKFWSTGLFDIGVPANQKHMIRADLKPGAELADGWTSEEGVSAGFVKLPRVVNPDKLLRANLKLKVEPKGTKTLASIKSDLEAMGFGPVTVDETADYNLVVGLPKDRLAKGFADSKVLMDFTTVSGAKAMQTNTVTTNALIKAVSLDIVKPGLVLMVR